MKTAVAILLVLTSRPLCGWTVPFQGSGEEPEVFDDTWRELSSLGSNRYPPVSINEIPLEDIDGNIPLDIDDEPEEAEFELDSEGVGGSQDTEEDEEDEEGSGEGNQVDSNEIQSSSTTVRPKNSILNSMYGILPLAFQRMINDSSSAVNEVFKKERANIMRLEKELNRIIQKAMTAMLTFNGTTTNTTDVVEDGKGNQFKVETMIKKGDKNQTFVVETIQSVPPSGNRTKRSNWFAEPAQ